MNKLNTFIIVMITIVIMIVFSFKLQAQLADAPRADLMITDGVVNSIAKANGKIYVGGSFSMVGEYSGHAVNFDPAGNVDNSFPKVNGNVYTIISDNAGGWYLGGDFTAVGGIERLRLVHILANKTVDPNWHPEANGTVHELTIWGDRIYIGGAFSEIDSVARKGIAALELSTGELTNWDPESNRFSMVGTIHSIVKGDSTLYVGGIFKNIGGVDRNSIAELDTSTGNSTGWDPHNGATNLGDQFFEKLIVKDSLLILGGTFSKIGDSTFSLRPLPKLIKYC